MATITGIVQDATGDVLQVAIHFESRSTPLVYPGGGVVTHTTTQRTWSLPTDGSFSVELLPGSYFVTYYTYPKLTQFLISVPNNISEATIDQLVVPSLIAPTTSYVSDGVNTYAMTVIVVEGIPTISLTLAPSAPTPVPFIVPAVPGPDTYTLSVLVVEGVPTLQLTLN